MARMQGLALPSGNRSLLFIAALAGLAAAVLFVVAVNDGDSKSNAGGTTGFGGNTVAAVKSIVKGQKIESDMVGIKTAPTDLLVPGALDDPAKVIGQYATNDIGAGEQVTATRISVSPPADCGLACGFEHGTVATSLQVKEGTAVGGNLLAGNKVNVVATSKIKNDGSVKDCSSGNILRTQTILQNVRVLSVAQEQVNTDGTTGDTKKQPGAGTITLALSPEDSQVLIAAQEQAKTVSTSLRSNGDNEIREVAPLNTCDYE
jgi:Flp pilus assembly protein CpaB